MQVRSQILMILFAMLLSAFFVSPKASAQIRDQVYVGTKPHSMGDAFVAVADDGNAIQWNPAGLSQIESIEASFSYADLFGLGINSYYASFITRLYFIPSLTDYLTLGADWYGLQTGDAELNFTRNQFDFSIGIKPPKSLPFLRNLGFGITAKYLTLGAALDGNQEADATGWGWDFGLLYHLGALPVLPQGLRLGLMIQDVGGTDISQQKQTRQVTDEVHKQNVRWGFSYRPFENWPGSKFPISEPLFALDFDDRIHIGVELWFFKSLALRAGIQKDLFTNEPSTFSFGIGLTLKSQDIPTTTVDYALTNSPVLPNTNKQFGGTIVFRNDPRLIRLEGAHMNDVFASLYLHYSRPGISIGEVKLRNVSKDTLQAWISFEQNQYMESQTADTAKIAPEEPIHVPLRAVFKPSVFNAPSGRFTATIKVTYWYKELPFTTEIALDYELYRKNYLTWDDPRKAAAFVTFDDESLTKFNAQALRNRRGIEGIELFPWFFNSNVGDALRIFHALKAYGLNYRPDPVHPFPELTEYQPDQILYPAQILRRRRITERAGDCDDLSVLYASLLQNAGIPSALVSEPTHLFLMFDSGLPVSQGRTLPLPSNRFIPFNGNLWIPIDAAQIPNLTFTEAWGKGTERLRETVIDTFFQIADAQRKYPAPRLRFRAKWEPTIPDYAAALHTDLEALLFLKRQYFQSFEDNLTDEHLSRLKRTELRNLYGVILARNNDYSRAKEQFQQILADSSTYAAAWNNMANIEFIRGNFAAAETFYNRALNNALFHHGIYLNLAMLYQMRIIEASTVEARFYQQKSDEAILEAARLFNGHPQSAFDHLGYPGEYIDGKAEGYLKGVKRRIKKVKRFVDKAFKDFTRNGKVRKVVMDRSGSKGEGETDVERTAILWWNY